LLVGCEATRHLKTNQLLLKDEPIFEGGKSLSAELLASAIKTHPNTKLVKPKIYLHSYNLGMSIARDSSYLKKLYLKIDPSKYYLNNFVWLLTKVIGEPPALISKKIIVADCKNIEDLYYSEGFLDCKVTAEIKPVKLSKKKRNVKFIVKEGVGYVIDSLYYITSDRNLLGVVSSEKSGSLLKMGGRLREVDLSEERVRIANLLKDRGYFRFSTGLISFEIDSTIKRNSNEVIRGVSVGVILPDSVGCYQIDSVQIAVEPSSLDFKKGNTLVTIHPQTLSLEDRKHYKLSERRLSSKLPFYFSNYPSEFKKLNLNLVSQRVFIKPGEAYNQSNIRKTVNLLQGMGVFKGVAVSYGVNDSAKLLNAKINLTMLRRYDFKIGAEGFFQEDARLQNNLLPGFGGTMRFTDRNVFGQAERLEIQGSGNISFYRADEKSDLKELFLFGAKISLTIPRFLITHTVKRDLTFFQPSTNFSLSQNQDRREEFSRSTFTGIWKYIWFNLPFSQRVRSEFSPISLTVINSDLSDGFNNTIDSLSPQIREVVRQDFTPRYSTKSSFYYSYNGNYGISRKKFSYYMKGGIEIGGNLPFLVDYLGKQNGRGDGDIKDSRIVGNFIYGQFYRFSGEGKIYKPLGKKSEWISRLNFGFGGGFNHTPIIPFENRFFGGGVNSMRGWLSNTLGPGTLKIEGSNLVTPGGEYSLEINTEIRQDIYGPLETALFFDVGNVWLSNRSAMLGLPAETRFTLKNFRMGIDVGIGFRFDFSLLLIRIDVAQQLYAPDIEDFVVKSLNNIGGKRIQYNLGIGYPF